MRAAALSFRRLTIRADCASFFGPVLKGAVEYRMKPYLISAGVAVGTVALSLAFFFAGFLVRGAVDQSRPVAPVAQVGGQTTLPAGQAAASAPAVSSPAAAPAPNAPFVGQINVDGYPARGPENAAITIVEFADFQCPFCKTFFDQTQPLVFATYGDKVRYVFRDFPIPQLHPQAEKAAEGGRCAFEQGKFWEYHDRLFQNQGALDVPGLKASALALGLNTTAFNSCLDSGKYASAIQTSYKEGVSYGVAGRPRSSSMDESSSARSRFLWSSK